MQNIIQKTIKTPEIYATKEYDKFKRVTGNRKLDKGHVFELTQAISRHNLLDKFPVLVTKDNYLLDGQHRIAVAKANKLSFYVLTLDMHLEDEVVASINSVQRAWKIIDYINFYAERGNEQYIFLNETSGEYGITPANLIALIKGGSTNNLKYGKLSLYSTPEEKQACLMLIDAYSEMKDLLPHEVFIDRDFVKAFRIMATKIDMPALKDRIEQYDKPITQQVKTVDYLRVFEDILNRKKHLENYTRLFE